MKKLLVPKGKTEDEYYELIRKNSEEIRALREHEKHLHAALNEAIRRETEEKYKALYTKEG